MAEIKIRLDELNDPRIDDIIAVEKSLTANSTGVFVENVKTPLYLNPAFYYATSACFASLLVWAITEPFVDDSDQNSQAIFFISDYLLFGPVAGIMSMFIGITFGLANRNLKQSFILGIVGLGIGLGATIVTTIIADILYGISGSIVASIADRDALMEGKIKGVAFFVQMCGRGLAWSIVSCGAGLSLGIILKSKKMLLNGLAGGIVGGALGGILFDPINRFIVGNMQDASVSRAIGIVLVGIFTGLFIGIFENISKESWLLMLKGPLAGKQFIIFKSPIFLGSAPKCEIYLFKDPHIEPKHATIVMSSKKYILEDLKSDQGTFVNGKKINNKHVLQPEDVITLGETVLKYQEKRK
jgi:hypothetical protein